MADDGWTPLAHQLAEKLHDAERTIRALRYNLLEAQGWVTKARNESDRLKAEKLALEIRLAETVESARAYIERLERQRGL